MMLFSASGFLVAGWMFLELDLWWAAGCFAAGVVSVGIALDRTDLEIHGAHTMADQAQHQYLRAINDAEEVRSKLISAQKALGRARLLN